MIASRFVLAALAVVVLASATVVLAAAPATVPVYMSWYSNVNMTLIQPGGGQTAYGVASYQQDEQHNRTSFFGSTGNNYVADFDASIVYYLDYYGACQYTCALTGDTACDSQVDGNSLCSYDQINRSQFVDEEEVDGIATNHYLWEDPLAGIDMASHELWVTQDANPVPVQEVADFHPFGTWQANITQIFTDFVIGRPPAANFAFTGAQYCQDGGDQCTNTKLTRFLRPKKVLREL